GAHVLADPRREASVAAWGAIQTAGKTQFPRVALRPAETMPRLSPGTGAGSASVAGMLDRKSTRLNSSHVKTSYAVFCLKKKTNQHELVGLVQDGKIREDRCH